MYNNTTCIENLSENLSEKTIVNIDTNRNSLTEIILDLSEQVETRIECLKIFYDKFGNQEILEIINKLSTMYQFSGTKILEKYLYEICMKTTIPSSLKIMIVKSMCHYKGTELAYKALDYVCQNMSDADTPYKIDAIYFLMINKNYKQKAIEYFCEIINDKNLDCDYRYRTIVSLENKKIPEYIYFLTKSSLAFFYEIKNRILYRILASQVLLQKCNLTKSEINNIENTLLLFCQDPDLDYNLRADSADVVLQLGSDDNKPKAKKIIMMLGRENRKVKTIFDNAQNVHTTEIEQSVLKGLDFLSNISINTISGVPGTPEINLDYIKKEIKNLLDQEKPKKGDNNEIKETYKQKVDKINISLNRIELDRVLYGKYNCTLVYILIKIWSYLSSHKSRKQIEQRVLEELVDMSGTCSSGFVSRLINIISGFGDFNLTISWRDQIVANFTGRLNARVKDITNEEKILENAKIYQIKEEKDEENNIISIKEQLETFQEKVLEEMAIHNCNFTSKSNFFKFFIKNTIDLRQELIEEFKPYISDDDFELYFRDAISIYEVG